MGALLTTFSLTFVLVLLALMGLLVSWLWKGEAFKGGSCGRKPLKKRGEGCGKDITCILCNPQAHEKPKNTDLDTEHDEDDDDNEQHTK